jgi:outer membrane protein TolC
MRVQTWLLLGTAFLAGCVLPPRESVHPRPLAQDSVGLSGAEVQPAADGWWDSFRDPQLDRLIRLGLKDSPTLAQAQARVGAALAQVQTAQASLLPSANLDASALYQRAPQNYLFPPPLAGHTVWMSQAGASLGWDIDFWGRQADAVHRAQDLTLAARLDEDNARLIARGYRGALRDAAPEHRRHHSPARQSGPRYAARDSRGRGPAAAGSRGP